jgi:hypothetical protein
MVPPVFWYLRHLSSYKMINQSRRRRRSASYGRTELLQEVKPLLTIVCRTIRAWIHMLFWMMLSSRDRTRLISPLSLVKPISSKLRREMKLATVLSLRSCQYLLLLSRIHPLHHQRQLMEMLWLLNGWHLIMAVHKSLLTRFRSNSQMGSSVSIM